MPMHMCASMPVYVCVHTRTYMNSSETLGIDFLKVEK